jgi:hypothetical protein
MSPPIHWSIGDVPVDNAKVYLATLGQFWCSAKAYLPVTAVEKKKIHNWTIKAETNLYKLMNNCGAYDPPAKEVKDLGDWYFAQGNEVRDLGMMAVEQAPRIFTVAHLLLVSSQTDRPYLIHATQFCNELQVSKHSYVDDWSVLPGV